MTSETEALNADEDRYADANLHFCESCPLPKLLVDYEHLFEILQDQLTLIRDDVGRIAARIDVMEHDSKVVTKR